MYFKLWRFCTIIISKLSFPSILLRDLQNVHSTQNMDFKLWINSCLTFVSQF